MSHSAETVSYQTFVIRDLSLAGNQEISIPFKAKTIECTIIVTDTFPHSIGHCDEIMNQRCLYAFLNGGLPVNSSNDSLIRYTLDNANITDGKIVQINDNNIAIEWTKIGSGAIGTAVVSILATTH